MRTFTLHRLGPILVLVALPCILLWPVFAGRVLLPAHLLTDVLPWRPLDSRAMAVWNPLQFDGIAQFYPWRKFAAETLRSGFLPLWNPYEFCGTPFLANSQSAVLYPPNILFAIMKPALAFGVSAIVHLAATGLFLYAYCRRGARLGRLASLLGAAAWQLCTWQVSWLALPTFLDTSSWFPLALLLAHRLGQRPVAGGAVALGACLGVMLLAGHLQVALYGMLLAGAYAVVQLVQSRIKVVIVVALAALTLAVAIGIDAPQLLPTLELSRVSHRSGAHASLAAYRGYIALAMPLEQLVTLYVPGFYGYPGDRGTPIPRPSDPPGTIVYHGEGSYAGSLNFAETACYVGLATLLLTIIGTWRGWRGNSTVRFFALAALCALLVALGTPLAGLFYFCIPGFSQTGSPARILVVWSLAASVLAAFGCEYVLDRKGRVGIPAALTAGLGFMLVGFATLSLSREAGSFSAVFSSIVNDLRIMAALVLVIAIAFAGYGCGRIGRFAMGAVLVGLVAADLLGAGMGYNRAVKQSDVYPVTPLVSWLVQHSGQDRVMVENRGWSIAAAPSAILPPNAATVYGFLEAQGYDSLQTGQYKSFVARIDGGSDPSPAANGNIVFTWGQPNAFTRLAALRYFVLAREVPELGPPAYAGADGVVYVDGGALPRVTLSNGHAVLFSQPSPTRLVISTLSPGPVTIADQWYPGWTAKQEGRALPVIEKPGVFRTVENVRRGALELRFEPVSFRFGLYLSCVTFGLIVAFITRELAARRANEPPR
ncbi:MAG: hypothetical protein P4L33_04045 [Capsulimonadaceae bacterium]|nr:hypothetical protein [Capsulimonadaceae bacterium]